MLPEDLALQDMQGGGDISGTAGHAGGGDISGTAGHAGGGDISDLLSLRDCTVISISVLVNIGKINPPMFDMNTYLPSLKGYEGSRLVFAKQSAAAAEASHAHSY